MTRNEDYVDLEFYYKGQEKYSCYEPVDLKEESQAIMKTINDIFTRSVMHVLYYRIPNNRRYSLYFNSFWLFFYIVFKK